MRFYPRLILVSGIALLMGSCDRGFSMHDFFFRVDSLSGPRDMFYGWVQSRYDKPVFAICFISAETYMPGNLVDTSNARITHVHGQRVNISSSRKAIYALRTDFSLEALPLSTEEVATILSFLDLAGMHLQPIQNNAIWKEKIVPHLNTFSIDQLRR